MIRPEEMQYVNMKIPQSNKLAIMNSLYHAKLIEFVNLNPEIMLKTNQLKKTPQYAQEKGLLESIRTKLQYLSNILADNDITNTKCCTDKAKSDCLCKTQNLEDLNKEITQLLTNIIENRDLTKETQKRIETLKRELAITGELQFLNFSKDQHLQEESKLQLSFSAGTIEMSRLYLLKSTLKTLVRGNLIFHENVNFDMKQFCELNNISTLEDSNNYCIFVVYSNADSKRLDDICISLGASILINKNLKIMEAINSLNELIEIYTDQNLCYISLLENLSLKLEIYQNSHKRLLQIYDNLSYGKVHDKLIYFEGWVPKGKIRTLEKIIINEENEGIEDINFIGVFKRKVEDENTISQESSSVSLKSTENLKKINYELIESKDSLLYDLQIGPIRRENILKKPTYIPCMEIFQGYQDMSESFGISATNELNPALFTIFLFPYLFGAMYSDVLHGILFIIIGYLIHKYKRNLENVSGISILISGRYLMILNGISAVLWGLFLNEFAGIHFINPLGISKEWLNSPKLSEFQNSLKLKLSLIIGYFHMLLGSLIALYNHKSKKEYSKLFCFWLPQFLAFNSFLGYLVLLIYIKFITGKDIPILSSLVNMYTKPFEKPQTSDLFYTYQFEVQRCLLILILISIPWMMFASCIYSSIRRPLDVNSLNPNSLSPNSLNVVSTDSIVDTKSVVSTDSIVTNKEDTKAIVTNKEDNKDIVTNKEDTKAIVTNKEDTKAIVDTKSVVNNKDIVTNKEDNKDIATNKETEEDEDEEDHESLLMYGVETMEFTISLISNSSSYLRIWAVNMAHSELSKVTYNMLLKTEKITFLSILLLIIKFPAFCVVTISILVGLEGMSSTLNAMRLNWIEFYTKFFKASGRKYLPFGIHEDEE